MISALLLLLAAATSDEATVREALATPALRRDLAALERSWQTASRRCRRDQACLTKLRDGRLAFYKALAARVSSANPTLLDLSAVALTGGWTVGPYRSADGGRMGAPVGDLPAAGTHLDFTPGRACAETCRDLGLEPSLAAAGSEDRAIAAAIGTARYWTVHEDGRATYRLAERDGAMFIIGTHCRAPAADCSGAIAPLMPDTGARLVNLAPKAPT